MIDEAIIMKVVVKHNEKELTIRWGDDVLEFMLDNKKIFSGDWSHNFEIVFKRALEIWGSHSLSTKAREEQ